MFSESSAQFCDDFCDTGWPLGDNLNIIDVNLAVMST